MGKAGAHGRLLAKAGPGHPVHRNAFSRGAKGKCGVYFPVTDFHSSAGGNLWQGNVWDEATVRP
jgi:hypothetical protein